MTEADATWKFWQVDRLIKHLGPLAGRSDRGFDPGTRLSVRRPSLVGFGVEPVPGVRLQLAADLRRYPLNVALGVSRASSPSAITSGVQACSVFPAS